jgi:hypothetical protein
VSKRIQIKRKIAKYQKFSKTQNDEEKISGGALDFF